MCLLPSGCSVKLLNLTYEECFIFCQTSINKIHQEFDRDISMAQIYSRVFQNNAVSINTNELVETDKTKPHTMQLTIIRAYY